MSITLSGQVVQVLVASRTDAIISSPADKIEVVYGHGVSGDRHVGSARRLDVRESAMLEFGFSKGIMIANHRQFSAVSEEDLQAITSDLNLPSPIPSGCLGENIIVRGIPEFSQLPIGTMLFFQRSDGWARAAVLIIWDENKPCRTPGEEIQRHFPEVADIGMRFPKAAINRRGVVGSVYCSGSIHRGDVVDAVLPARIKEYPVSQK